MFSVLLKRKYSLSWLCPGQLGSWATLEALGKVFNYLCGSLGERLWLLHGLGSRVGEFLPNSSLDGTSFETL
eukprot:559074-Pelagomonas_calceolata.AAC.1